MIEQFKVKTDDTLNENAIVIAKKLSEVILKVNDMEAKLQSAPPTNISSPKFPLLEDVQTAYEINESGDVTSCENGAIEFAHNFIVENFGR